MEEIDPRHLLVDIANILDRLHISYMITGGMAVFVWGRPRFTADIDIVIELKSEDINNLEKALMALSKAGYIDRGSMERALMRRGEFNFIDGETGVKVDFWILGDDSFNTERLKRRITRKILNNNICFISPEDLILSKLRWYKQAESSKHLEDIESSLKIQKKLDMRYIRKCAKKQSTIKFFESLLKKIKR